MGKKRRWCRAFVPLLVTSLLSVHYATSAESAAATRLGSVFLLRNVSEDELDALNPYCQYFIAGRMLHPNATGVGAVTPPSNAQEQHGPLKEIMSQLDMDARSGSPLSRILSHLYDPFSNLILIACSDGPVFLPFGNLPPSLCSASNWSSYLSDCVPLTGVTERDLLSVATTANSKLYDIFTPHTPSEQRSSPEPPAPLVLLLPGNAELDPNLKSLITSLVALVKSTSSSDKRISELLDRIVKLLKQNNDYTAFTASKLGS